MKRPVLFAFMVLCAVFWTVMGVAPEVVTPKSQIEAAVEHQRAPTAETAAKLEAAHRMRKTSQTNALGLMVVSWIGVGVLWMTQRTSPTEAK
jgi:hypothetical protein